MFSKLPELCHIRLSTYEIEIISVKTYILDESKKLNLVKEVNSNGKTVFILCISYLFNIILYLECLKSPLSIDYNSQIFPLIPKDKSKKKNEGLFEKFLVSHNCIIILVMHS